MPTYDYECSACKHKFEHFQKITDEPLLKCPECKKKKLVRLFGIGAAVVFKGSGFYQTDYRSENYKKAADQDKSSGGGNSGESSAEKSADKSTSSEGKSSSNDKVTRKPAGGGNSKPDGGSGEPKPKPGKDSPKKPKD